MTLRATPLGPSPLIKAAALAPPRPPPPRRRLQSNTAQLTAAVASQVETTKSGLDMLHRAHGALLKMRENFALINSLCTECQSLIDCDDKIQLLSAVHHNLRKTLQDVENIAALPVEAAEAEELLKDDANLLQAYECLAILEGTSMKAQSALESGTHVNLQEARNLNSYFQKARRRAAGRHPRRACQGAGCQLTSECPPRAGQGDDGQV